MLVDFWEAASQNSTMIKKSRQFAVGRSHESFPELPIAAADNSSDNRDKLYLTIVLSIAAIIGIYLIVTTVLIAKDGVSYIHYAKALSSSPLEIIRDCSDYAPREYTPGYPFLILFAHKAANLFGQYSSALSWVYAGQGITLLCMILSLVPLYFIGKLLVGARNAFWGLLILVFLPYPAKFGSDILRDWPHILFLATGFWLLVRAVMLKRWWQFALVGVIAAIGYIIRPMCAQLIIYGILWLLYSLVKSGSRYSMRRGQTIAALISLVIGFMAVSTPYMFASGNVLPVRAKQIKEGFDGRDDSNEISVRNADTNYASLVPADIAKALRQLVGKVGANLRVYFLPFLFLGIYYLFRKSSCEPPIRFLMIAFVLLNIVMLTLRYTCLGYSLGKRYVLPLTVFTIFYVPIGLQLLAGWIDKLLRKTILKNSNAEKGTREWFFFFLVIGIGICLPKLLRPLRIEKQGYRMAAEWLKKNTPDDSLIVVSEREPRLAFYAERRSIRSWPQGRSMHADYAVKIHSRKTRPIYRDGVFTLNGKDSFIDIGANPIPSSGDFSISGWVYCEGDAVGKTDDYGTAFGSGTWTGHVKGLVVRCNHGNLSVSWGDGKGTRTMILEKNISTVNKHKWYHVALVYTTSDKKLNTYVNGVFKNGSTRAYANSGWSFRIGHSRRLNVSNAYWYGRVKDLRIYNKALPASDIMELYTKPNIQTKIPLVHIFESNKGKKKSRVVIYQMPLISIVSF